MSGMMQGMPIDITSERLIATNKVPPWLEARGADRCSLCTVFRWMEQKPGRPSLESIRIGGRTYTSEQALIRFFEARSANRGGQPTQRTETQKSKSLARAEAELAAAGV